MAERQEDRLRGRRGIDGTGEKLPLEVVETREADGGGVRPLVGEVVADPGERVDRREIATQAARQEPRPDREVLVVRARPLLALGVCGRERRHAAIASRARA